jgi:hypothetical protein
MYNTIISLPYPFNGVVQFSLGVVAIVFGLTMVFVAGEGPHKWWSFLTEIIIASLGVFIITIGIVIFLFGLVDLVGPVLAFVSSGG